MNYYKLNVSRHSKSIDTEFTVNVPGNISFLSLSDIIIAVTNMPDDYLHSFRFREIETIILRNGDHEIERAISERKMVVYDSFSTSIDTLFSSVKTGEYICGTSVSYDLTISLSNSEKMECLDCVGYEYRDPNDPEIIRLNAKTIARALEFFCFLPVNSLSDLDRFPTYRANDKIDHILFGQGIVEKTDNHGYVIAKFPEMESSIKISPKYKGLKRIA